MRIPEGLVGTTVGPLVQEIDARWLMAYAAALGDVHAEYLDTTRPERRDRPSDLPRLLRVARSPSSSGPRPCSESIAVRSVHATHDLRLHRRVRAGDRLSTTATVISSEPRAPGAYVVTRLETVDADGRPVSTTDYGSIYRGVECERAALPPRVAGLADSTGDAGTVRNRRRVMARRHDRLVGRGARPGRVSPIPIPSARGSGIPSTPTRPSPGPPDCPTSSCTAPRRSPWRCPRRSSARGSIRPPTSPGSRCRFTGMVPLPSVITVEGWEARGPPARAPIAFQVLGADGRLVLRDGRLIMAGPHDPQEARA